MRPQVGAATRDWPSLTASAVPGPRVAPVLPERVRRSCPAIQLIPGAGLRPRQFAHQTPMSSSHCSIRPVRGALQRRRPGDGAIDEKADHHVGNIEVRAPRRCLVRPHQVPQDAVFARRLEHHGHGVPRPPAGTTRLVDHTILPFTSGHSVRDVPRTRPQRVRPRRRDAPRRSCRRGPSAGPHQPCPSTSPHGDRRSAPGPPRGHR